MRCKVSTIAKSNFVEDYNLWSKLLKGLQQNSLVRNSVLKPCQCWDYSTNKTIEILVSQWVPWLWVLNNLAAVFSFTFLQCTIIENGLMTCSGVLCSIFSSLHYVCPVGTVLTALGVSNGSVGRGPGTSTIKLDERLASRKGACRDRVFHSYKIHGCCRGQCQKLWRNRVFYPAWYCENHEGSDEIRQNVLHVSAGITSDRNYFSLSKM